MFSEIVVNRLLKPSLRKTKFKAFLNAIFKRGNELGNLFKSFRSTTNERIKYNSQTLSLQEYLQQHFNNNNILIINNQNSISNPTTFWLNENQEKPTIGFLSETSIQPVYSYFLSEISSSSNNYDFQVQVPISLSIKEDEIRAIVDLMKLAGKKFVIIFV